MLKVKKVRRLMQAFNVFQMNGKHKNIQKMRNFHLNDSSSKVISFQACNDILPRKQLVEI